MKSNHFTILLTFILFLSSVKVVNAQYYTYVDPITRILDVNYAKPGTLPGSIDITSIGEAVYEIPLFISPGTAGMQPRISIVYRSNIEDGVLGRGFTIGGLSEIRRIPQNFYHDNNITGITLQNTDKFALDSNRLVLTSGTYGADSSVYATEIETFVNVIAHGSAGTGPSWFEVQTKDGKTAEYGNTADSKIEATGSSTIYLWRINRIKDHNNNYIDFKYEESNGESIIKEIKYTGNSATGLQPYNKIRFSYSSNPRLDLNTYYVAGSQVPSTKLLDSIRVVTEGNSLVREYRFKYNDAFYTHLNQITEYGSDQTFFNSTIFGWGATQTQFSNNNAFNNSKKDKFYLGDFNGDGRTDFVVTENKTSFTTSDKWKLYLATSTGTSFTYINEGSLNSQFKGFYVVDADGNGNDDILWRAREIVYYQCNPHPCDYGMMVSGSQTGDTVSISDSNIVDFYNPPPQDTCWDQCSYYQEAFRYYYYNGSGLTRGSTSYDLVFAPNGPADITLTPVELDGNGKSDYLALTSTKNVYAILGITLYGYPDFNSPGSVSIIDFDGDGKKDILVIKNTNSTVYSYNTLTGYFTSIYSSSSFPTINDRIFPGDYNGDKKTDLLYWRSGSGWSLKFSTGTGFVTSSNIPALVNTDPGASTTDYNYYITDFNGDRKDDIAESYKYQTQSKLKMFFSRGILFATPETNTYAKSVINQEYFQIGDFNGDGKKDLFYYDNSLTTNYVNICFFHKDELKHLVNAISNGFGLSTRVIYDRLNSGGTFYAKGSGAAFPVREFNGAYYAVSSIWDFNSYGDTTINKYEFESAKIHVQGKGFLGFMKTVTRFKKESMVAERIYSYNPAYYNVALEDYVYKCNNDVVSNTLSNTNQIISYGNNRIFPYAEQTDTWDNLNKIITQAWFDYDNYGNLIYSAAQYKNESQTIEAARYLITGFGSFGNYGIPNKVTEKTDSTIYSGEPAYVRKSAFQYDSNGNLTITIKDPGKNGEVTGTRLINAYGLVQRDSVSSDSLAPLVTSYEFDSKFRFVTRTTNPLGDHSTASYYPGTGNVQTITSIDSITISYDYDGFGQLIKTVNPLGHEIVRTILWDDVYVPPASPGYIIVTNAPGKPVVWETFNGSGQKTAVMTQGINGYVNKEFSYDLTGKLSLEKGPHYTYDWENAPYTSYTYDPFGRVTYINSNLSYSNITYDGRKTTIAYPGNKRREITINALKDVISIKENQDNNLVTNYSYHSSGQVRQVTSAGTTVSITYDEYGRPVSVTNPNSGTSYTSYNALGQKISYTDPKSNTSFHYYYDALGRIDHYSSPEGTTSYSYNSVGNGKEQIGSVTGPGGISYSYGYDEFGKIIQFNKNIPDDQSFTTSITYDVFGNDSTITYPGGFKIKKIYENGYLREIKNENNDRIWKLDSLNSFGSPRKYLLGTSNLTTAFRYDAHGFLTKKITGSREQTFNFDTQTGNLMSRRFKQGGAINLIESFTYDNLERLTSSTVTGRSPVNITYASNGNILSKTGVGSYYYNEYKINAVDSIINNPGSIPVTTQEINYTSFNKVSEITDSLNENSIRLDITYGPDQQRIRNIFYRNDTIIKTKCYSIDYEKDSTSAAVKQIYYINCPYGLVAINIRQNGTDSLYFPDTDHLGSILALVRNNGSEAEKFSYDAWGSRRNPTDWTYDNIPSSTIIDRGYTGHEHYDLFGLIDMNARVYDPVTGRFLSPDPVLQSPEFTQGYNGYSYCINNPLRFIDPTGYNKDEPLWQKIKAFFKKIFGKKDESNTESPEEIEFLDQQADPEIDELTGLPWLPVTGGGRPYTRYITDNTRSSTTSNYLSPFRFTNEYSFNESHWESCKLLPPVSLEYPITSPYSETNRKIPELNRNRPHLAIDIGTPLNTPIRSPWSGKIVASKDSNDGKILIIDLDYKYWGIGIRVIFIHLSGFVFSNNTVVNRGEVVGYTGYGGTGPHLHIGVDVGGTYIDPTLLFPYNY